MSTATNVALARRFWDGLNKRDLGVVDECLAEDFVWFVRPGKTMDRRAFKAVLAALLTMFPDLRLIEDHMVAAKRDSVAIRFVAVGTDVNACLQMPQTGKRLTIDQAYFMRFRDGKMQELRSYASGTGFGAGVTSN